jgi:hypothetical protein
MIAPRRMESLITTVLYCSVRSNSIDNEGAVALAGALEVNYSVTVLR